MKVTLNWLKQYVDFDWSPEQLAERLTMLGLEVEGVQKLAGDFDGIVVAQILTRDKVPNADKLSVCKVNDGRGERTIICGAQNHQPSDKVPLILPNFALPLKPGEKEPFVIKERKVFGFVSQGMMCSPQELGLPDAVEGLLILPADARVGQPFGEYLGRAGSDLVFDLEVTPNRPDLNSVIGIAREIAALTGNPLRLPAVGQASRLSPIEPDKLESGATPDLRCADLVAVRLDAPDLCPRYTARVVRGVKIGPSPDWLRSTLEKVGLRSINNVVDVTNYVMLESGQPLHAFDYHLVGQALRLSPTKEGEVRDRRDACPTIIVRRANAGEIFTTLDGQKHTLSPDHLLIADEQKGIALAGVMGGQNTEINDQTVDVLLESAWFLPANIRRTSKQLGLRTESSYRFERGADIGIADWASRRCAQLILETAGGQLAASVVDAYPQPVTLKQVSLRPQKVNDLLGITLRPEEIEYYLQQLGLKLAGRRPRPVSAEEVPATAPEPITFQIPTWRVDLKREVDLIEEIERLHGLEKVPATPPRGAIGAHLFDAVHDQIAEARRLLCAVGLNEAQGQTLISDAAARHFALAIGDAPAPLVLLANPLSSDMNALRPSLLPGLLDSLRHNLRHANHDVALFEVGRVFTATNAAPREERRVAMALTGQREAAFWSGSDRDANFDLADLKGRLEEFLEQFGLRGIQFSRRADHLGPWLESADITLGGKRVLGEMGQLSPLLAKHYDLRDAVLLAELNLDLLLDRRNPARSFKSLPAYPAMRRDVAMFVPETVTHDAVLATVRQVKAPNLEGVALFDIFRGQSVPTGQKSMAYAFTYRAADRTLTEVEVNGAQEKLIAALRQLLGATVRDT
jgi:phenylalanyl-tRNA synthetase beta chain